VEEVNSGICTCTLTGRATQAVIDSNARQGWVFEGMERVTGRRCGCICSQKLIIVFSKEN